MVGQLEEFDIRQRDECGFHCGNRHTHIAVRVPIRGFPDRYQSVFICDACWNQDHPDRVPVRVR